MSGTVRTRRQLSALTLGKIFVALSLVAAALLFQKAHLAAALRPGDTIEIQFSEAHRLRDDISDVKMSGVEIGVVRSVKRDGDLTTVKVKVDGDTLKAMGTAPSATIRPATMLGGNYYVDIEPGGRRGEFSGTIPMDRTHLPVELDGVASAFPSASRDGVRTSTKALDETLESGGKESLRALIKAAPPTLNSTTQVLLGLQGTQPKRDLATLVSAGENVSTVLSSQNAHLADIVEDLDTTANILEARRVDLAETSRTMPRTLDETVTMLDSLDGVLTSLEDTAEPARPAVHELAKLLKNADPVLARARPVVADLRTVLHDARPLVDTLIPTSRDLDATVNNLQGDVLDRVNGPILTRLGSNWHGKKGTLYEGGGADRPLYKETGYMLSNLAQANLMDANGSTISFLPGVGVDSLPAIPGLSLTDLFGLLNQMPGGAQ